MEIFTLKLSGHLFDNGDLLPTYVDLIRELWVGGYRMVVVTGGGSLARRYIELGRGLGINESLLDMLEAFNQASQRRLWRCSLVNY